MREMEHAIDIELIEEDDRQEHQCLGDILAKDSYHDIVVGIAQPLLTTTELQFHTQRIG